MAVRSAVHKGDAIAAVRNMHSKVDANAFPMPVVMEEIINCDTHYQLLNIIYKYNRGFCKFSHTNTPLCLTNPPWDYKYKDTLL